MALDVDLRARLTLPAMCAPMFLVSGPDLVVEACKSGIVGSLPRQNARSFQAFAAWLAEIRDALDSHSEQNPTSPIGPIAVNLTTALSSAELDRHLRLCSRYGVEIIVSAAGDPTEFTKQVHSWDLKVFHDVTTFRFAEKAIAAGVDGLTCIGAGGGGHSGLITHLILIPKIRSIFDGTIILAGAVSNGAAIRAAEILGADLAYLGTRFIATQESLATESYKKLLVSGNASDLVYTERIAGIPGNWLIDSIRRVGLDPAHLPAPQGRSRDHLPAGAEPWKTIWSAGQGIELIDDIPTVAELIRRLRREYVAACSTPDMVEAAQRPDQT
jgi:nitronate monooxygenase